MTDAESCEFKKWDVYDINCEGMRTLEVVPIEHGILRVILPDGTIKE